MIRRQHKIVILKYVTGKFWLLLFPVLRGLFTLRYDFHYWLKGAYLDIIVILLMLSSAIIKWYFVRFEADKKGIYVRKGVLLRREFRLCFSQISSARFYSPLLFRPFKAVECSVCTDCCRVKKGETRSDCILVVSETDYLQIYNNLTIENFDAKTSYKTSEKEVLIFSMLFSSTLSGTVYLGTLIVQGGKIVGEKIEMNFFSAVSNVTETVKFMADGTVPFSSALIMLIAGGWLLSFVINVFRHMHFEMRRFGRGFEVKNGYFSRWKYYVNYSRINCVDLHQSLIMKSAKIVSVHISCAGYGKGRNGQSVFVPVTTRKRAAAAVEGLLSDFTQSNNLVGAKQAYVWGPMAAAAGVLIASKLLSSIFPEWKSAVNFFGAMLEVLFLYLIAVRITARLTTGMGVSREALTLRYCKGFRFHTVIVPKARIAYIKIRRTLFQRAGGSCDVIVYTRGERAREYRVKGIAFKEGKNLVLHYDDIG